jgi:hypothetical protein
VGVRMRKKMLPNVDETIEIIEGFENPNCLNLHKDLAMVLVNEIKRLRIGAPSDFANTLSLDLARTKREKDIVDQQYRVALSIIHSIKDDAYRNGPVDIDTIQEIIEHETH